MTIHHLPLRRLLLLILLAVGFNLSACGEAKLSRAQAPGVSPEVATTVPSLSVATPSDAPPPNPPDGLVEVVNSANVARQKVRAREVPPNAPFVHAGHVMPYQMSLGRLEWMTELSPSNIAKAKVTINDRDADGFAHRKGDNSVDFDLSNGRGEHKVSLLLSRMQSVDVLVTDIAHPQWAIVTVADLRSGDRVRMATGDIGLVTSNENAPDQTVPRGRAIIIGTSERLTDTFLDVRTATDLVTTTPEHPFMVQGKGWIEAHKLQSGDVLDGSNGKSVEVASVALRKISPPQTVNNLETWPDHTFRVGKEGLLVHNGGCVTPPDVSKGKFALSEMKEWMSRWKMPDRQTLSEYIRDHAWRHGYPSQYGEYLRDAANFNKESAVLRELPDGALKWIRGNEFLIERDGKIVSFGLNPD